MAWQNIAKTLEMLASLGQLNDTTGAWQKVKAGSKGTSKGYGKEGDKGKGKGATRQCPWDDCRAAQNKQTTWGGVPNCHCCKRSFAKTPPVENMVGWAYKDLLSKKGGAPKGEAGKGAAGKGGAGKNGRGGKGGGGGAAVVTATAQEEQLAQLRLQRQAELKAAKDNAAQPAEATVLQEVAKTFNSTSAGGTKLYQLDTELTKETELVGALAAKVVP